MKKKVIFIISLIAVLLVTSFGTVSYYDKIKEKNNQIEVSLNDSNFRDTIASYIYAIDASLQEEDVDLLERYIVNEGVDVSTLTSKKDALESIHRWTSNEYLNVLKDENFIYTASVNKKDYTGNTNIDLEKIIKNGSWKDDYQWYLKINFDDKGTMHYISSENVLDEDEWLTASNVELYIDYYSIDEDGDEAYYSINEVNNPTNLDILMVVPKTLTATGNIYNSYFYAIDYDFYMVVLLGVVSTIISLFMLLYPVRIVKEVEPYRSLSKIKFGILVLAEIGVAVLISAFIYETLHWYVDGYLTRVCQTYKIPYSLMKACLMCIWMAYMFVTSLLVYEFKLIFHTGFKKFIKEYTVFGWLVNSSKSILAFDFKDHTNIIILKFVGLTLLVPLGILFICDVVLNVGGALTFVVECLYVIICTILVSSYIRKIKADYQVIDEYTKQICNGNFKDVSVIDAGVFYRLQLTLSQISEGFEKAVQEEVKSTKMKTELISNVSHDLKTPLTNIITYIDLLKTEELNDNERQYVDVLDRNAKRLNKLIVDLFEVSKANSGNIQLDKTEIDLIALIKQVQLDFEEPLTNKGLQVRFDTTLDKAMCDLDIDKTVRIFENLFVNVEKHAMDNTRVYIDVIQKNHNIVVTFKNISHEEIKFNDDEILERFVQGDESRTKGGSGLGLAIVKSFVEVQEGSFKVESDGDLFKAIITFPMI